MADELRLKIIPPFSHLGIPVFLYKLIVVTAKRKHKSDHLKEFQF